MAKSPKKRWQNIKPKYQAKTHQIKIRHLITAITVLSGAAIIPGQGASQTHAESCPDLKVIFARGSGGERYTSGHYLAFKESMENKLKTTSLTYEIDDLDYPAVSIDIGDGHLGTLVGAYVGSGEAYEFGESVKKGNEELLRVVNNSGCKNTKYVFAGYSQGALVLLNDLPKIDPSKVIYTATFGDPKIYLPEGEGIFPAACRGQNLSDYRVHVPDCHAYKGILGYRDPYVASGYAGKIGTWCNKRDVLCSSYFVVSDHTSYAEAGLYEDASKLIFSKIAAEFDFKNQYTSPHDTAIMIDSTGSMSSLFSKYRTEAMKLAEKTLNAGGRVALYDYRDVAEGYVPVQRCSFETCTLETFEAGLDAIEIDGGGDNPESLLSSSLHVMKDLNWRLGSTKSLVVLTDAGYHSPDLDGTTFYDVQKLSKQIDPVNFYIITDESNLATYQSLAEATDGAVVSSADDISVSTDLILERYDSLPRVEEEFEDEIYDNFIPTLKITNLEETEDSAKVTFSTDGDKTIVILNDAVLGITDRTEIILTDLDRSVINSLSLVPLSAIRRGDPVTTDLKSLIGFGGTSISSETLTPVVPKVPNTGRR